MRTILPWALAVGLVCTFAERLSPDERGLLLAKPVTLSGVVVDTSDTPIQHAEVHYVKRWDQHVQMADRYGRFTIRTRAPSIVFRKRGYDSSFVRVGQTNNVRIVLQPTNRVLSS